MIKKGTVVSFLFILSTAVQFISQIIVLRLFGAKHDLDVFLAAVALPTIIVTIIYGTVNDVFLPLYAEKRTRSVEKGDEFFFSQGIAFTLLTFPITFILMLSADHISQNLYGARGVDFANEVTTQLRYLFLSIPFAVIATLFGVYYYVRKDFARFPFAQAIGSIINLLIIVIFTPSIGIWALVGAFVINILFQIICVLPHRITFRTHFRTILPIILTLLPLIIGNLALRSDVLILRSYASLLPIGYISYLNLVSKIFSMATGAVTIGIQLVLLPHLVEYLALKDHTKAISIVNKSKLLGIALSIVVAFCVLTFSPAVINFVFVGGKFSPHDATIVNSLFPLFILPAVGWGVVNIFFQPLLALKKTLSIAVVAIISFIVGSEVTKQTVDLLGVLNGISVGLTAMLFSGIIGSEILWQYYKRKLTS